MMFSVILLKMTAAFFTFLVETFPAELTDERFVPGVNPYVSVERRASVERLPALVTFMRLFLNRTRKTSS